MAVDLNDYVGTLQRQVVPLGSTLPEGVTNNDLLLHLIDAFWQARLDGLLEGYTVDENGRITPLEGSVDLGREWIALITLYAAIKILSLQILGTKTAFRAKAGPVEFEQQTSATMLAEMLKQLRQTKDQILAELDEMGETETVYLDALSVRVFSPYSYWPSPELT